MSFRSAIVNPEGTHKKNQPLIFNRKSPLEGFGVCVLIFRPEFVETKRGSVVFSLENLKTCGWIPNQMYTKVVWAK
jgi:hypothetical protein